MSDSYHNYWRAKRLCGLAARGFATASRRLRAGLPAQITLKRANALQRRGRDAWEKVPA